MSKLVDKARLQKLAQALDARMKDAVKGVQDQLDALKGDGEGSVVDQIADLKTELQKEIDADVKVVADELAKQKDAEQEGTLAKKIADEAARAEAAEEAIEKRLDDEGGLVDRLEAVEQFVEDHDDTKRDAQIAANKAAIDKLNGADTENGSVAKAVKDAVDAEAGLREEADGELSDRIAVFEAGGAQDVAAKEARLVAAEEDIARLDGEDTVEGSVKKQIKDAITEVNGAAETLAGRVKANEDKLAGLENATVKAEIQVVQDELDKQKDAAQQGTLAHQIKVEKERMDAFMADADVQQGAVDTLKELQEYINTHGQAAQKMVDDIAANKTAIETEANRAVDEEARIEGKFDKIIGEHSIAADENGEGGAEGSGLRKEIEDAESNAKAYTNAIMTEINGRVEEVAQSTGQAMTELTTAIELEATRAGKEEAAIRQEMATAIGQHAAEGVEASGLRKEMDDAVAAEKSRAEAEEADIRADFAAADTALHNAIKGEMAQVVASLNVQIVNNQLQIGLGKGVDFVTLNQFELDMATDDDIAEIIDGLDPAQGEQGE